MGYGVYELYDTFDITKELVLLEGVLPRNTAYKHFIPIIIAAIS